MATLNEHNNNLSYISGLIDGAFNNQPEVRKTCRGYLELVSQDLRTIDEFVGKQNQKIQELEVTITRQDTVVSQLKFRLSKLENNNGDS